MESQSAVNINRATAKPEHPLGSQYLDLTYQSTGQGARVLVYVQNASAGALVAGNAVMFKADTQTFAVDISGANTPLERFAGAAVAAIPQNYYGWVVAKGYHPALIGDGSAAKNDGIATATAGAFTTNSTNPTVGWAYTDDSGSPATFAGRLMSAYV